RPLRAPEPEAEDWRELRPVLDQELNRLPDKYRTAVVLCHLEGRTRKEAARQLGLAEGTLSGRLTTARRLLAKRLSRRGVAMTGALLAGVLSRSPVSAQVAGGGRGGHAAGDRPGDGGRRDPGRRRDALAVPGEPGEAVGDRAGGRRDSWR